MTGDTGDQENFIRLINSVVSVLYDDFVLRPTCFSEKSPSELRTLFPINPCRKTVESLRDELIAIVRNVAQHSANLTSRKSFAYMSSNPTKVSIVADLVCSALNQSLDSWDQSPAGTELEQALIEYLAKISGIQIDKGYVTPGATISNLQAITLARDAAIEHASSGQVGESRYELLPRLRAFCSTETHFSIDKGIHVAGLGQESLIKLPAKPDGTLNAPLLERALREQVAKGNVPFLIIGTAGSTNCGAIDDLRELARLGEQHGCWFHVDAAHGGACLFSSELRKSLDGLEMASSFAFDAHKFLYQPISCGLFLVAKHKRGNSRPVFYEAPYLDNSGLIFEEAFDSYHYTIQTTRRFDALKLYLSLRLLGQPFFERLVESCVGLTRYFWRCVVNDPCFAAPVEPQLNILLFRYESKLLSENAIEKVNELIWHQLFRSGKATVSLTRFEGKQFLRAVIMNPLTTATDLDEILLSIREIGQEVEAKCKV